MVSIIFFLLVMLFVSNLTQRVTSSGIKFWELTCVTAVHSLNLKKKFGTVFFLLFSWGHLSGLWIYLQ